LFTLVADTSHRASGYLSTFTYLSLHVSASVAEQRSPGKSTLVDAAYGDAAMGTPAETAPVQRKGGGGDTEGLHAAAAETRAAPAQAW